MEIRESMVFLSTVFNHKQFFWQDGSKSILVSWGGGIIHSMSCEALEAAHICCT